MYRVENITQAYSQAPWRKQLQWIGLFMLAMIMVAMVAGIYLSVSAQATTAGREVQIMDADMDELVARRASPRELREAAFTKGFRTLADEGLQRVLEGVTSLSEVARAIDLTSRAR